MAVIAARSGSLTHRYEICIPHFSFVRTAGCLTDAVAPVFGNMQESPSDQLKSILSLKSPSFILQEGNSL